MSIPVPHAVSYVLVDVDTGNVLAGYNEHLRLSPASLSKVLTALIAVTYLSPKEGVPGTTVSENVYPNQVGHRKGRGVATARRAAIPVGIFSQ